MANNKTQNYDVMQHIRNIYAILGIEVPENIEDYTSIEEALESITDMNKKFWVGTKAKYEEDFGNGTITPTTICIITDDFVPAK